MKRGAQAAMSMLAFAMLTMDGAFAQQPREGQPTPEGIDLQPAATPIMREIHEFHNFLLPIIVVISAFVLLLLLWVMIRYNRRANPTPRKFTHNMFVEVIWTIVPVLILVTIAWKSFPLIYREERIPENAQLTLKVTGQSWLWNFEYPDLGVRLTSNLLPEDQARAQNRPYLLATDTPLYVPVHTTVRVLITSNDVIHSFAVPSFGIKEDAIQGRVNDTWFNVDHEGVYYGQCSELCGINHAYMPVEVHAVSQAEFERWVAANGGHMTATPAAASTTAPAPAGTAPAAPAPAAQSPTR